ncbi:hypothetical protein ACNFIA_24800 [Pseudomonas sp. NY15437]|uniref:hypothetical protein n=1 Tax=Pseudomonas sp. NY15437 TaxID=3400360 RepID=UPI003A86D7AD
MPAISGQSPLKSMNDTCRRELMPACRPVAGMARSYTGIHVVSFCWVIRDQLNCVQFN